MNTNFLNVTRKVLSIRRPILRRFCKDFRVKTTINEGFSPNMGFSDDDLIEKNFVYYLIENKTFIQMYQLDYYSDKTIEIIANKIGRPVDEVSAYLQRIDYKINPKYPYRYISSYKIDCDLGNRYNFLSFNPGHSYQGNFEYRRDD